MLIFHFLFLSLSVELRYDYTVSVSLSVSVSVYVDCTFKFILYWTFFTHICMYVSVLQSVRYSHNYIFIYILYTKMCTVLHTAVHTFVHWEYLLHNFISHSLALFPSYPFWILACSLYVRRVLASQPASQPVVDQFNWFVYCTCECVYGYPSPRARESYVLQTNPSVCIRATHARMYICVCLCVCK